jgi:hypothetical protein
LDELKITWNISPGLRGDASVPRSVIAGIVAVRFILLPLLGTVLVKAAIRFGVIQPDPLYQFILLLQYAVPPAMNIGQTSSHSWRTEFSFAWNAD